MYERNKNKITKALTLLIVFLLTVTMFFSTIPVSATTSVPPTPDLSGLTAKYWWNATKQLDGDINATNINNDVTYTFVDDNATGKGTGCLIHIRNESSTTYATVAATFRYNFTWAPNVGTLHGYMKIPVQSGYAGWTDDKYFRISSNSQGYFTVYLSDTEGENDTLRISNGTVYADYTIPRLPRDIWFDFILSFYIDSGNLIGFIYVHSEGFTLSKSVSLPTSDTALIAWYFQFGSTEYLLDGKIYVDDFTYYAEGYKLEDYVVFPHIDMPWYKGWDWVDYCWVWDKVHAEANYGDADLDSSIPYYGIDWYIQNFTLRKTLVWINDIKYLNETLKNTKLQEIWVQTVDISNDTLMKEISWVAAHDDRIKYFMMPDYSSNVQSGNFNYSKVKHAIDMLRYYDTNLKILGSMFPTTYLSLNDTMEGLMDAWGIAWGPRNDISVYVPEMVQYYKNKYPNEERYVYWYTHDWYYHDGVPNGVSEWFFRWAHDEIVNGNISGVLPLGPARYMNYPDSEYPRTRESIYFFQRLLSVAYDSGGNVITINDEEDGENVDITHLELPLLYSGENTMTLRSYMNTTVELEIPSAWNYTNVIVYDNTTGEDINWTEGSVIFDTHSGHEYTIYDSEISVDEIPGGVAQFLMMVSISLMISSFYIWKKGRTRR